MTETKTSRFSQILDKNHIELRTMRRKSVAWFNAQVASLTSVSKMRAETLMRGDQASKGNQIIPGNLYMYIYDPKHKETLPYYDTFPLVFPFDRDSKGFIGLNMHYLPYQYRARLLDKLMDFRTDTNMDEKTRLKFSWALISSVSKYVHPCVKRYLFDHVKTPFKAIHPSDWATAMLLPIERFEKESLEEVWRQSLRKTRRV